MAPARNRVALEKDRALLDGFREGRRDALEHVYRSFVQDVVAIVRHGFVAGDARIFGEPDPQTQLDVTQDVFLRAFSKTARRGYDGLRPYGPYLRRIARNLLVDRARKSGREVAVDDVEDLRDDFDRPSVDPDAESSLHFARLSEATRAFLATQDSELQQFVAHRFESEQSQAEVAKTMKITRRRVRTLEARAESGLRAWLDERGLTW